MIHREKNRIRGITECHTRKWLWELPVTPQGTWAWGRKAAQSSTFPAEPQVLPVLHTICRSLGFFNPPKICPVFAESAEAQQDFQEYLRVFSPPRAELRSREGVEQTQSCFSRPTFTVRRRGFHSKFLLVLTRFWVLRTALLAGYTLR